MARTLTLIFFGLFCLILANIELSAQPNPPLDQDAKTEEYILMRRAQPLFNGKNLLQITQHLTPHEIIALKIPLNLKDSTITKLLSIASLPPRRYRLVNVGKIMVMKMEHLIRSSIAEDATEEEIAADILHSFYQTPLPGDQSLDAGAVALIKNSTLRDYLKLHISGIRRAPWSEDHLRLLLKGMFAITFQKNIPKAHQALLLRHAALDSNNSFTELFPLFQSRDILSGNENNQSLSESLINQAQQLLAPVRSSIFTSPHRSKALDSATPFYASSTLEANIYEEKIKDESLKAAWSGGGDNNASPPTSGSSHGSGISASHQAGITDHFEMVDIMPSQHWQSKARLSSLAWAKDIASGLLALILTFISSWSLPEILVNFRWTYVQTNMHLYSRRLFG